MVTITKTKATNNLAGDIQRILQPLGGVEAFVKSHDRVLLKPNWNTADPYPASSALDFLEAVIDIVKTAHPTQIILGDSCTMSQKTAKVMEQLGMVELGKRYGIEVVNFDEGGFITRNVNGAYLKSVRIPESLEHVDKLILLPCLKTHRYARFTMSLKLGVGFMKKIDRIKLHTSHLEEKIAELNLAYKPDLIIMDGRKAFVTNGPDAGGLVEPGILMAGTDRIAIDVEALKILTSYRVQNKLTDNIWHLPQIQRAAELGLGVSNEKEYRAMNV